MDPSLPPASSNISNEIEVLFGKLKDLPPLDSSCLHEEFAIVSDFTNIVTELQKFESSLTSSQKWKLLSLQMMADILKSEIPFINSSFDHYN
ncbi:hypothetical protein A2U01_0060243, partial [Trifolium medium]|nr:hypothetical protein [Trifolium medium]